MKEIVMGLHWDPPQAGMHSEPVDLDALCVLYDSHGAVLEVIHPAHPRSADGSVIHTGDSRTGTSSWDDERIFVFLDALAPAVSQLVFIVASTSRHPFDEVAAARCHVSDRLSETQWVRVDLTALTGRTAATVATLSRGDSGWSIRTDIQSLDERVPAEVQSVLTSAKREHSAATGPR